MSAIVSINDPIIAKSRASPQQAIDYGARAGGVDIAPYVVALWARCQTEQLDALILFAQFCDEADIGRSSRWKSNHNPAGLAVVQSGDPDPGNWTPAQAAAVHVAAMLIALKRPAKGADLPAATNTAPGATAFLQRWRAKYSAPQCPAVAALNDLSAHYVDARGEAQATWAWNTAYATQIAGHASAVLAMPIITPAPAPEKGSIVTDLKMQADLIPLPPFESRIVTDAENSAWNNLGPRTVKGFVLHRMLGSLSGTDQWFRRGAASNGLTDFGSDAASGTVYLWNSPLGFAGNGASADRAPWASGPYNANGDAWGDGKAFVSTYGIDAVNRDETAWEISGNYGDPWSPAAQAAAAQACAHYAHNYGIQWDAFPVHPQDGFSFVRWHNEICGPAEKPCPGQVVMDATNAWIEQVRAILKAAQMQGATPRPTPTPAPAPKPAPPKWARKNPPTKESATIVRFGRQLTATRQTTPRNAADPNAPATAPDFAPGDGVTATWLEVGSDSKLWGCAAGGSRFLLADFQ